MTRLESLSPERSSAKYSAWDGVWKSALNTYAAECDGPSFYHYPSSKMADVPMLTATLRHFRLLRPDFLASATWNRLREVTSHTRRHTPAGEAMDQKVPIAHTCCSPGKIFAPAEQRYNVPSSDNSGESRHVAKISLRRWPREIFSYMWRYFKPDSLHATPIDAVLKFGRNSADFMRTFKTFIKWDSVAESHFIYTFSDAIEDNWSPTEDKRIQHQKDYLTSF